MNHGSPDRTGDMMRLMRNRGAVALIVLICGIAVAAVAADYKYVGSAKSNKYHRPTCIHAKRIKPGNLVAFRSAREARERGYLPCKVCRPPTRD